MVQNETVLTMKIQIFCVKNPQINYNVRQSSPLVQSPTLCWKHAARELRSCLEHNLRAGNGWNLKSSNNIIRRSLESLKKKNIRKSRKDKCLQTRTCTSHPAEGRALGLGQSPSPHWGKIRVTERADSNEIKGMFFFHM